MTVSISLVADLSQFQCIRDSSTTHSITHNGFLSHPWLWTRYLFFRDEFELALTDSSRRSHLDTFFPFSSIYFPASPDSNYYHFVDCLRLSQDIFELIDKLSVFYSPLQGSIWVDAHPFNIFSFGYASTINTINCITSYCLYPKIHKHLSTTYHLNSSTIILLLQEFYWLQRLGLDITYSREQVSTTSLLNIVFRRSTPIEPSVFSLQAHEIALSRRGLLLASIKPPSFVFILFALVYKSLAISFHYLLAFSKRFIKQLYRHYLRWPFLHDIHFFIRQMRSGSYRRNLNSKTYDFDLAICIATDDRAHLLEMTFSEIHELLKAHAISIKVFVSVSSITDLFRIQSVSANYDFVNVILVQNNPLGRKWQSCVNHASSQNPRCVMILGSDDIPSSQFIYNSFCQAFAKVDNTPVCLLPTSWNIFSQADLKFYRCSLNTRIQPIPIGSGRTYPSDISDDFVSSIFNQSLDSNLDNKGFFLAKKYSDHGRLYITHLVSEQGILLSIKNSSSVEMNSLQAIFDSPSIELAELTDKESSSIITAFLSPKIRKFLLQNDI